MQALGKNVNNYITIPCLALIINIIAHSIRSIPKQGAIYFPTDKHEKNLTTINENLI